MASQIIARIKVVHTLTFSTEVDIEEEFGATSIDDCMKRANTIADERMRHACGATANLLTSVRSFFVPIA